MALGSKSRQAKEADMHARHGSSLSHLFVSALSVSFDWLVRPRTGPRAASQKWAGSCLVNPRRPSPRPPQRGPVKRLARVRANAFGSVKPFLLSPLPGVGFAWFAAHGSTREEDAFVRRRGRGTNLPPCPLSTQGLILYGVDRESTAPSPKTAMRGPPSPRWIIVRC